MSHTVKFLSLQKSELEYEVSIRGSTPASTVQDLRKQIAKLGPLFPSEDILDSPYEPADDLKGVIETLVKVQAHLQAPLDDNGLLRTQNLLNHLYHRINRIISDDSTKLQYEACVVQFKNFTDSFNALKNKKDEPLPSTSHNESPIQNLPLNISVTCDRASTDIGKVKYDGKTCVRAFIQRITEFCSTRNIPESKALSYATEIFTGDALHWYRSVRDRVSTWYDLLELLKNDFDQSDYDYRLLAEIRSRTQGETENITIYLSIMSGLFSRLSKNISEDDKIEIILHNIRPCYATVLASTSEIRTLESLQTLCRNYENIQARLANFHEPTGVTSSTLAPEFAYKGNGSKINANQKSYKSNFNQYTKFNKQNYSDTNQYKYNKNSNFNYTNINEKYIHAIDSTKPRYCPRCRVNTHNLRQCTENKQNIYCFKCGRKDVKTPQCPDCNKHNTSDISKN